MASPEAALEWLHWTISQVDDKGEPRQFDTTALRELRDIKAERGRAIATLPVSPPVMNRYGTLHGGWIATLVDTVGTAALITVSPEGRMSLNINVNYLSKAEGEVIIDAQVVRLGRSVAMIHVELRDATTSQLLVQGTHMKAIGEKEVPLAELVGLQHALPVAPEAPAAAAHRPASLESFGSHSKRVLGVAVRRKSTEGAGAAAAAEAQRKSCGSPSPRAKV